MTEDEMFMCLPLRVATKHEIHDAMIKAGFQPFEWNGMNFIDKKKRRRSP